MLPDPDACYSALLAHDVRFDGHFFVGVRTTRVYCRPVCRVRVPKRENCRFFESAAAAELRGFRPCLRCRPELAPGRAGIDSASRLARAAALLIEGGELDRGGVEAVAARLGTSARHLRRIFGAEFGVTPIEYAQTQRLLLAKRLLTDSVLSATEVAYAAGFRSLRRFNAVFRERYRLSPTELRAKAGARPAAALRFRLAYRPPYDWPRVFAFLAARLIAGVESIDANGYHRSITLRDGAHERHGWLSARPDAERSLLEIDLSPSLAAVIPQVLQRLRHMFDLDCEPDEVLRALPLMAQAGGPMRLIGAFDGFELAVRGVLGQQVSVRAAHTLAARFAAAFGQPLADSAAPAGLTHLFPSPQAVAAVEASAIAALGITRRRAETLRLLAQRLADGELRLEPRQPVDEALVQLAAIPGIGDWTAQYIAMRALSWPDAFPAGDLAVLRSLGVTTAAQARERTRAWQPWRAYAVIDLWSRPSGEPT
ncbi:MAG: AlkA N-terminal domain-containing protein [Burkholderiaceae bacterium]